MVRKKYRADTEREFIGMQIPNRIGGYYKILPWKGDRGGRDNVKLYPVYCPECSKDSELYYRDFLIRKGDALAGYCPCGCHRGYKYDKKQGEILAKRKCDEIDVEFLGFSEDYVSLERTKLITHCKEHDFYTTSYTYNRLKKSEYGCYLCSIEGLRNSKFKTTEDFIKSFNLDLTAVVFKDSITKDKQGHKRYWYYICDICSYDEYVKAGVCSGVFHTSAGELQRGKKPCRCTTYFKIPKHIAEYNINKRCKEKQYKFLDWVSSYENGTSKFRYVCNIDHTNISDHHKFVTCGYGCGRCNAYGFYEGRVNELDYLYIVLLISETEVIFKIGRSFNPEERYKEYEKSYEVVELYKHCDIHNKIFPMEQDLHFRCQDYHTTPSKVFGGSANECFSCELNTHIRFIIKDIEEGKYTRLQKPEITDS